MLYYILLYFFIYAFIGWCLEVSYSALETGKWSNRGFLNGPLCPIYGVGVVVILILLLPISDFGPLLFAGGVILCSLIELITGFVMEKVFHQRWWDYSTEHFNIGGYVCLKFSLYWGVGVTFVVKLVHPTIAFFVEKIPHTIGLVILIILAAAFIVDAIDTVRTMMGLNKQLAAIHKAATVIHKVSDSISENLFEGTMKAIEEKEGLGQKLQDDGELLKARAEIVADTLKRGQRRLLRAFPNVQSTLYHEDLNVIKHAVTEHDLK